MTYYTTTDEDLRSVADGVRSARKTVQDLEFPSGFNAALANVEKLYDNFVSETETGSFISFNDGSDDIGLKGLRVNFTPVQSGNGDPSPDNIRPISGWTGCTVQNGGKNLVTVQPIYGQPMTIVDFGSDVTIPELTISFDADNASCAVPTASFVDLRKADGTHNYKAVKFYSNENGVLFDTANTNYSGRFRNTYTNVQCRKIVCYYASSSYGRWASDALSNFQIEIGGVATEYEEYSGTKIQVSWASEVGTVYGGMLDLLSGILTITHWGYDLENLTWTERFAGSTNHTISASFDRAYAYENFSFMLENYVRAGYVSGESGIRNPDQMRVGAHTFYRSTQTSSKTIYFCLPIGTSKPSGLVVFRLAESQTIQLTPSEMFTLLGENHIWTDVGELEVEYYADTQLYIEKRIEAVKQMIANVEASYTATTNHTSGDCFIVGDILYKATANIANGATITPNTNCVATTVAEQLALLNQS